MLGTPLAGQARPEGHTRAAWLLLTLGAWGSGLLLPAPVTPAALRCLLQKQPRECGAEMQGRPRPSGSRGCVWFATVAAAGVTLCPAPPALGHLELWGWARRGGQGCLAGRGVWPQATSGRQPDDPLRRSVLGSQRKVARVGRGDSGRGWWRPAPGPRALAAPQRGGGRQGPEGHQAANPRPSPASLSYPKPAPLPFGATPTLHFLP